MREFSPLWHKCQKSKGTVRIAMFANVLSPNFLYNLSGVACPNTSICLNRVFRLASQFQWKLTYGAFTQVEGDGGKIYKIFNQISQSILLILSRICDPFLKSRKRAFTVISYVFCPTFRILYPFRFRNLTFDEICDEPTVEKTKATNINSECLCCFLCVLWVVWPNKILTRTSKVLLLQQQVFVTQ